MSSYFGRVYFIASVIIGRECSLFYQPVYLLILFSFTVLPHQTDCVAASYVRKTAFYSVLTANHWLFASRAQATWRGSKGYLFIRAYVVIGILCLFIMGLVVSQLSSLFLHFLQLNSTFFPRLDRRNDQDWCWCRR